MNTESIKEEFLKEAKKIFAMRDDREVTFTSNLRTDLNTTSMQYFALSSIVEDLTGEELTYAQLKSCETIEDILKLASGVSA